MIYICKYTRSEPHASPATEMSVVKVMIHSSLKLSEPFHSMTSITACEVSVLGSGVDTGSGLLIR